MIWITLHKFRESFPWNSLMGGFESEVGWILFWVWCLWMLSCAERVHIFRQDRHTDLKPDGILQMLHRWCDLWHWYNFFELISWVFCLRRSTCSQALMSFPHSFLQNHITHHRDLPEPTSLHTQPNCNWSIVNLQYIWMWGKCFCSHCDSIYNYATQACRVVIAGVLLNIQSALSRC